jgi:hypothetical protein
MATGISCPPGRLGPRKLGEPGALAVTDAAVRTLARPRIKNMSKLCRVGGK